MEATTRRAELVAEVADLHEQQMESFTAATFEGWTPEGTASHGKRSDRISGLQRELSALARDAKSQSATVIAATLK